EATRPIDFYDGFGHPGGERTLLRFFCSRAIGMAMQRAGARWKADGVHASELELPAKLASLAATLLGDGRWTPDDIQNLLQVVALFGHRVLGIPARIDLVRHLNETVRGETALHTLK